MRPNRVRQVLFGLIALAVFLPACAQTVRIPKIDDADYIFPDLKRGELSSNEEKTVRRAWDDMLAGRESRVEPALSKLLTDRPDLRPARVVLGFSQLRANRFSLAEATFSAVLASEPNDVASLVGLASIKRKQGFLDEALPLYMRAERLRPKDEGLARRASEVKLAVAEAAIARAGSLSQEGKKPEAIAMLQRALEVAPELNPVRLELADLLVESGQRTEALAVLAAAQDADRNIVIRAATIRFEDGDLDGAEMGLKRGLKDVAEDPDGAALLARIRENRASLALPEPLRGIEKAPRITRAELAALVVERVESLKGHKPVAAGEVASDLSRTWARPQILRAIELGLMDVYPNHSFQPSGVVRRGELAVVAARVLDLSGWGKANGVTPKDMSPSHLQYGSVVRVLSAAVMQATPTGAFEPWRIVTGAEAKSVVDALARLSSQR